MVHLQNEVLQDQKVVLRRDDAYFLGPNLRLQNCELELRTRARSLTVTDTVIEDSHIAAVQKFGGFRWRYVFFKHCSFSGLFDGCDFGNWPENVPAQGGIEDCDFSQSILQGCRFLDCDVKQIRFPPWPCFTFIDPVDHLPELNLKEWPGDTRTIVQTFAVFPVGTNAVTYNASQIAKTLDTTIDDLRRFLEICEDVVM